MITLNDWGYDKIDAIEPLWRELIDCNASASVHFADYYKTFSFPVRKSFLEEKIAGGQVVRIFTIQGLEKDGFCAISYHPEQGFGTIEMIYVKAIHRGKGYGSALFEKALSALKEAGIQDISLDVAYGNEKAVAFYEKYGFHIFTQTLINWKKQ